MIFVGSTDGLFVVGREGPVAFDGHEVGWLEFGGDEWWAIVDGHDLWSGDPHGRWTRRGSHDDHRLNCLLPASGGVYTGTSEAHLLRFEDDAARPLLGFESVPGRDEWFTPWGGPPDVRSLARSDAGTLFANVHVGGIPRSRDGSNWVPTIDIHSDVHEVVAHDGSVLAATAIGLAVSRDEGETWEFYEEGLHSSYCRALRVCGRWVLITACVSPHGGRAAVYRRPLEADKAFEKCHQGLPEWLDDNIDTGWVDARGSEVAFVTADGAVYSSLDCGASWKETGSGFPGPRFLVIAE